MQPNIIARYNTPTMLFIENDCLRGQYKDMIRFPLYTSVCPKGIPWKLCQYSTVNLNQ